jgi:hypothetical protein
LLHIREFFFLGLKKKIQIESLKKMAKKVPLIVSASIFSILLLIIISICILLSSVSELNTCDIESSNMKYIANTNIADIVISFTTMPERIKSDIFRKALSCMFEQNVRPREIHLNVPYISKRTGQEYVIPDWILNTAIIIRRCEDYGPATKYIPTLAHFAETNQRILVYDDDSFMPRDLVEKFDKLSLEFPQHCFTVMGARFFPEKYYGFSSQVSILKKIVCSIISEEYHEMPENEIMSPSDLVIGWGGYLITPNMVKLEDVSDFEKLPKSAFYVDDVVMSGSLLKNGTKIFVGHGLPESKMSIQHIFMLAWSKIATVKSESLVLSDNKDRSHDHVMEEYFHSYWQFLK